MLRAEITPNGIEVRLSRADVVLLGLSAVLFVILLVAAGWLVAAVALVLSAVGAGAVAIVQAA